MRFAYADPPYLGMGARMYGRLHPDAAEFDRIDTHQSLIERLSAEFDAWALSMGSRNLKTLLPFCPEDIRIGAWVKPFVPFKPNVNPAYAWEPVIFRGGRKRDRWEPKIRDYCSAGLQVSTGYPGGKPAPFAWWIFDLLGARPEDEFIDLFPGSGGVGLAWEDWCRVHRGFPLLDGVR